MAKCPICNSRKGKRQCLLFSGAVCSLCCGNTRTHESCLACRFYQKPVRKYTDVPAYTPSEMEQHRELEHYGNTIEGALCAYDQENENVLKDNDAIRIIELLIDMHHFGDKQIEAETQIIARGVDYVEQAIKKDLRNLSAEVLVKSWGGIRVVAKRRTKIGREYMTIIHQYVGQRITSRIRVLRQ